MQKRTLTSDLLLLVAAVIWGVAFVPQRTAMAHISPFFFTGVRFALGAAALCPFLFWRNGLDASARPARADFHLGLWAGGALTGLFLFLAIGLQQYAMIYTTAGKAGFISGLYVVPVALLGLFWRQFPPLGTWLGAIVAIAGLYLLAVPEDWSVNHGDLLVLASIFFWAGQIQMIGHMTGHVRILPLAIIEFATCAGLSLLVAVCFEPVSFAAVQASGWEILYTGLISAGIAYTLQIAGQRGSPPTHAAIIMSLETVFAATAGWLFLQETMGPRALAGCGLMLGGMVFSQWAQARATIRATRIPGPLSPAVP
ncbi:MAG: DMT family transporter [Phycisphaeraceae bacterium]|nr:DMT family transporter [Phycisphaeraceae bacterium]